MRRLCYSLQQETSQPIITSLAPSKSSAVPPNYHHQKILERKGLFLQKDVSSAEQYHRCTQMVRMYGKYSNVRVLYRMVQVLTQGILRKQEFTKQRSIATSKCDRPNICNRRCQFSQRRLFSFFHDSQGHCSTTAL